MRHIARLVPLLSLLSQSTLAQTSAEEKQLFEDDFSEEQFFRLEEDAVTIASKHAQSTREAPAAITVLTAEDIHRYGFRDLRDVLRAVAGWYAADGHDFLYAGSRGVMFRGDQNTRILILVDGHTWNEAWSSSSSIDEGLGLDLDAVARVEVLQGPSSTLYGSNAFLGILNIVTRAGSELPRAAAHLDLGSHGHTQATAVAGGTAGSLKYHLRLGVLDEAGQPLYFPERAATSESAGFTSPAADATRAYRGFVKLNLHDLQILGLFAERLKHLPTAPFDTILNAPENLVLQRRWFAELRYSRELSKRLETMLRVSYDGYRFGDSLLTHGEVGGATDQAGGQSERDDSYLFRDIARADWVGGELQVGMLLVDGLELRDRLTFGSEGQWVNTLSESFIESSTDEETPTGPLASVPRQAVNVGAYVQNELVFLQNFTLVAGARFDYNSNFFGNLSPLAALSPRGALLYRSRSDSTFKLMYARGFRNPSIYEAYFDDSSDILANEALLPESIHNAELAYEYRLQKRFRLNLSTYFFRASELLRQQSVCLDEGGSVEDCGEVRQQFQNVAQVEGLGSELTATYNFESGAHARATLALQKASDLESFRPLANSPAVVSNLMGSLPLLKDRVLLSGQLHLVASQQAGPDAAGGFETVPGYVLGSLVLSTRGLARGLETSLGVYNVLNQQVQDVAVSEKIVVDFSDIPILTVPADARTFNFQLSYRF